MRMDKLTSKFQLALADAQSFAVGRDHQFIEPAHLMSALLEQDISIAQSLLLKAGVNINQLRDGLGEVIDRIPIVEGDATGEIHLSSNLTKILNIADKLAQDRGDKYISSELFILAGYQDRGDLGRILKKSGAHKESLEKAIEDVRGGAQVDDQNAEDARQALE